jgi:hypothetical protein
MSLASSKLACLHAVRPARMPDAGRTVTCRIDNNWVERRIRPIALGLQNGPFAGSLRAGRVVEHGSIDQALPA